MVGSREDQELAAGVSAILETLRGWQNTQAVILKILQDNKELLVKAGAWESIEGIIIKAADGFFNALLPLAFDCEGIDVGELKTRMLNLAKPHAEFYDQSRPEDKLVN